MIADRVRVNAEGGTGNQAEGEEDRGRGTVDRERDRKVRGNGNGGGKERGHCAGGEAARTWAGHVELRGEGGAGRRIRRWRSAHTGTRLGLGRSGSRYGDKRERDLPGGG